MSGADFGVFSHRLIIGNFGNGGIHAFDPTMVTGRGEFQHRGPLHSAGGPPIAIEGLWGLAFIGGFVEQIGALVHNNSVVNIGIISSLILPTEAVFRRAAYIMTSPAVQSLGFSGGPLFVVSVPSPAMVVYAVLYLFVLLGVAVRQFSRRDL